MTPHRRTPVRVHALAAALPLVVMLTTGVGAAWANPEPGAPHPSEHPLIPHAGTTPGSTGGLPSSHDSGKDPIGGGTHGIDPLHPAEPAGNHESGSNTTGGHGGRPPDGRPGTDTHSIIPTPAHPDPAPANPTGGSPVKPPVFADTGQQYKESMANADSMQRALRAAGVSGSSVWESLKRTYNKVMGNPKLPAHFGQADALPPHLQDLLRKNGGSFVDTLRSKLGDLDREMLRATYDKDYYREPLMGYRSYDKFVQSHGEQATYEQLQKLSPADRLQYLMNFGQQTQSQKAAAQQLERDLRYLQSHDPMLAELQEARDAATKATRVSSVIYNEVLSRTLRDLRREMGIDDDASGESAGHEGPGTGGGDKPKDPTTAQGQGEPPGTPSTRHQDALDAVARHQIIWDATRKANPDLFSRLSKAYDQVVGNANLPPNFNDPTSLPSHLQTLVSASGGYEGAMRADIGDLDRELLRATFDRTYYQEPLMGYASYDKFMAKYGDRATAVQVQKLSPPDRLQYLANHGTQSADEAAAIQARVRDFQFAQMKNPQRDNLNRLRDELRKQEALNAAIFDQLADQALRDARKTLNDALDDDI